MSFSAQRDSRSCRVVGQGIASGGILGIAARNGDILLHIRTAITPESAPR